MEVQRGQVWSKGRDDELQQVQRFEVNFLIFVLKDRTHQHRERLEQVSGSLLVKLSAHYLL